MGVKILQGLGMYWRLVVTLRRVVTCFIYISSPYRAVNTVSSGYKTSQLMLYREIMAVYSEIHTKHINTLCGQNVELLNVKLAVHTVTAGL